MQSLSPLSLVSLGLGLTLALLTLLFILRIVLTWYPQIETQRFPFNWIFAVTEPCLAPTRRLIPPLGGVDIAPIVWVGICSLLRELLLGQQGILTLVMRQMV
jgi:YggT family protein